ncbi:NAD(+)/NADH kinase [Rhizosphaericola mali]|uniref:Sugar kinase n=1 Tax=Rhizosphaericola mali TaxID=2545455 RepID=A0A5P2G7M4_9BACT|nr:NAD(+)/NADH kinase [Rhizosphaericola mali]QES90698.1 sugar kinase [Rhizosphaericola mali]
MKFEYAIIVKNKTRMESLIERFNTKEQARFFIERSGGDFADYELEHEQFYSAFNDVQQRLSPIIKNKVVERSFIPSYLFAESNLIIVIGQDGLVANVAKYSKELPIIAINPDPERYDGILLPYNSSNFIEAVKKVIAQNYHTKQMHFAEVKLNDGQSLLAVNDLFIGISSHTSARYKIKINGKEENHSSSGIIVATKTGSSGWLSSMFNMAYGLTHITDIHYPKLKEVDLYFAVREPFKSHATQTDICSGKISNGNQLVIESMMPTNGFIFSDGIEQDFLQFNSGAIATIQLSKQLANLVIN